MELILYLALVLPLIGCIILMVMSIIQMGMEIYDDWKNQKKNK